MLSSRQSALTKGKKPLRAASRVLGASYGSSSSVFARCFHTPNGTSGILRSVRKGGLKRLYSTNSGGDGGGSNASGAGLPLYRGCTFSRLSVIVSHNSTGRLINAWKDTPTKWYPLPLAVGALLLVVIQYRKKVKRARQEVELNEEGREVIKLKGPWHVRLITVTKICAFLV